MIQGSQEWLAMRAGKVTASRVADVIAKTKTGYGASRANYAAQLVAERLTGKAAEMYVSKEMQHGTECEPQARAAYEFDRSAEVAEVAFVTHPTISDAGASPDGLVSDDGLIEIKCPNTSTHIETLLSSQIPDKYIVQMQWQMACTAREWCDFVSFDPRMPEAMQLCILRVQRDPVRIAELEDAVRRFLAEVSLTVSSLQAKYGQQAAA
jgi:putative phage-type endonuclease